MEERRVQPAGELDINYNPELDINYNPELDINYNPERELETLELGVATARQNHARYLKLKKLKYLKKWIS